MAQREDFEVQSDPRPHEAAERSKKGNQDGRHRDQSLSASAGKFNSINTYDIFRRHNGRRTASLRPSNGSMSNEALPQTVEHVENRLARGARSEAGPR
jgi:hypothetical protein